MTNVKELVQQLCCHAYWYAEDTGDYDMEFLFSYEDANALLTAIIAAVLLESIPQAPEANQQ